jgi:hypothetical protein
VDDVPSLKRVQPLPLRQIPQHGHPVLAPRGTQRPIGRHSHC